MTRPAPNPNPFTPGNTRVYSQKERASLELAQQARAEIRTQVRYFMSQLSPEQLEEVRASMSLEQLQRYAPHRAH